MGDGLPWIQKWRREWAFQLPLLGCSSLLVVNSPQCLQPHQSHPPQSLGDLVPPLQVGYHSDAGVFCKFEHSWDYSKERHKRGLGLLNKAPGNPHIVKAGFLSTRALKDVSPAWHISRMCSKDQQQSAALGLRIKGYWWDKRLGCLENQSLNFLYP